MELLYICRYIVFYVQIANLCHFAALCAYHVALFGSETLLVFGIGSELVVYNKVGIDEKGYGVVYGGTADPEFPVVLHVLEQLINVKASVYRVYGLEYRETLRGPATSVLFQIVRKHLSHRLCNLAVFHVIAKLSIFL